MSGSVNDLVREVTSYVAALQSENVRLRNLVKDMGELLDMLSECDMVCVHYHNGCVGDCYYVNARRELGMEVEK